MIIRRIKQSINEFKARINFLVGQSKELEWAHIYHDTIRGRKWLENLAISPGRWAGNYSFFYILTKILAEYKPKKIIEFGLGESSMLISSFIENELKESTHLIIEQNIEWTEEFNKKFSLTPNSSVMHMELEVKDIKGYPVKTYRSIQDNINNTFDLYVIDGPHGSERYSRVDICFLAVRFQSNDEFIIMIDDFDRQGEQDTANNLIEILTKKGLKIFTGVYTGNKSQIVITTQKYRYATSM